MPNEHEILCVQCQYNGKPVECAKERKLGFAQGLWCGQLVTHKEGAKDEEQT